MITLSGITIYPIKSLQGISLSQSALDGRGLQHDRRMMLVDTQGRFLSQRELPQMAQLRVERQAETLLIWDAQGTCLTVPLRPAAGPERPVQVWNSISPAQAVSPEADRWFSERLGRPCQLVYQPPTALRATNPAFAPGFAVSFADGYPFLFSSESSLADLAAVTAPNLEMRAFRPNLVFSGALPWAEKDWKGVQLGEIHFELVKPCTRCVIVTQDPLTGQSRHPTLLKELNQKQSWQGQPVFGINAVTRSESGCLRIGDRLIPSI
ncbi:MAG: MOSC domain-containing protein [Candidatus Sericytochromatia bacterium]